MNAWFWPGLRLEFLRQRIKEKFHTQAAFAKKLRLSPSEVSRWLKGQNRPRTDLDVLGLCIALDIDPVLLWDINESTHAATCASAQASLAGMTALPVGFGLIGEMLAPAGTWPPEDIAKQYRRSWTIVEFIHNDLRRANRFAWARVRAHARPVVMHWAFRDIGAPMAGLWRSYGSVVAHSRQVSLLNYNGLYEETRCSAADVFSVGTWFGIGAAQFRVASLHGFELEADVSESDRSSTVGEVHFAFPGGWTPT